MFNKSEFTCVHVLIGIIFVILIYYFLIKDKEDFGIRSNHGMCHYMGNKHDCLDKTNCKWSKGRCKYYGETERCPDCDDIKMFII